MPSEGLDRRVRKTRQLLQHALRDLILEKGYDAITVQDILDRADVGRSTFYAHFRNKDGLLISGFEILYAELEDAMALADQDRSPNVSDMALALFRHTENNRKAFRSLLGGSSGEILMRTAREHIDEHVREEIRTISTEVRDPAIIEAVVEFQASALLSLNSWWLSTNSTLSPEEMCRLFVTLTRPGVEAALK